MKEKSRFYSMRKGDFPDVNEGPREAGCQDTTPLQLVSCLLWHSHQHNRPHQSLDRNAPTPRNVELPENGSAESSMLRAEMRGRQRRFFSTQGRSSTIAPRNGPLECSCLVPSGPDEVFSITFTRSGSDQENLFIAASSRDPGLSTPQNRRSHERQLRELPDCPTPKDSKEPCSENGGKK